MDVSKLVRKRVLLKLGTQSRYNRYGEVAEYKILELAPSGNWIKLMNIYGNKFWRAIADVSFIEELRELEKPPKDE